MTSRSIGRVRKKQHIIKRTITICDNCKCEVAEKMTQIPNDPLKIQNSMTRTSINHHYVTWEIDIANFPRIDYYAQTCTFTLSNSHLIVNFNYIS